MGFPEVLNLNLWFIVPKNVSKPLLPRPLGQSSSFDQFEFWPLRRWRPARVMPFYLALRMLNIATVYSSNTLSCSELNGEHAGECFTSLRHILTPRWACKAKKLFLRKFDLWPDLTRSNVDLGPKTICAIARSRRGASTVFFREALLPPGADRQGGRTNPPDRLRYEKCPDRARVRAHYCHLHVSFTRRLPPLMRAAQNPYCPQNKSYRADNDIMARHVWAVRPIMTSARHKCLLRKEALF